MRHFPVNYAYFANRVGSTDSDMISLYLGDILVWELDFNRSDKLYQIIPEFINGDIEYGIIKDGYLHETKIINYAYGKTYVYVKAISDQSILVKGININELDDVVLSTQTNPDDRHASAVFLSARSPLRNIRAAYRELTIVNYVPYTYYTHGFPGGYIGLVHGDGVNFSVWNGTASSYLVGKNEGVFDKIFTHEGSGVQLFLPLDIKEGITYKTLLQLSYSDDTTYYHGYISDNDGILKYIGTIARPGIYRFHRTGGFIENVGRINGHLFKRELKVGNCWYYTENEVSPVTEYEFLCNDINNAGSYVNGSTVIIHMGGGVGGNDTRYTIPVQTNVEVGQPPALPQLPPQLPMV